MAPALPTEFLTRPMAHRAYHDLAQQRPENSRVAVRAAIEAGYGIEIDVQLTSDGGAVVFHDYQLDRLAGLPGVMRARTMEDAQAIPLLGASDETIPSISNVLEIVDGQVPVLIEIKDQDGAMGPDVGPLEEAVARVLKNCTGPVAVMSFNPHSVAEMARLCP
ncbi:MAG: glycerophosphodiester phosphodiesterase family protein, partial [Pseudomonadota bacterium]